MIILDSIWQLVTSNELLFSGSDDKTILVIFFLNFIKIKSYI